MYSACNAYIIRLLLILIVEGAIDVELLTKTLNEYQRRLLSSLPMDDDNFVAMLDKNNFFVGNNKATMKAKETEVNKASYFLEYIIERHVDAYFVRLLNVMEVYGGDERSLAREIKEKLGISKFAHYACMQSCHLE